MTDVSNITASADAADSAPKPMRETHFDFQHKVFSLPAAFFALEPTSKQPVLNILLGDLKAALPFNTLKDSFSIEADGHDSRLLGLVERGLAYVKQIRPGEKIPGELLDGTASWSVDDRHRMIARGRLTVQLVSWITGSEMIVVDLEELEQIVEDPNTKDRMKTAFIQLAEKLGIHSDNAEQYINDRIDDLTQELSYIEALRDRFKHIRALSEAFIKLQQIYRADRTFCSELQRMAGLIKKPLKMYDSIFEQADAQTGEIMGALRTFDATVNFIRKIRDDLRTRLMEWEDVLQAWDGVPVERSQQVEQLQKMTYRFLASHFIETKVWERK
ncbi:hypothetical protein [Azospirillum sp. TSO22-1]|uniref:hypothetical protein n=1 Tax=Azospirillum sp. TSO22-1 TaxID=716789 RepID=UPI000D60ACF9|nr:hypothetical protein [Azospirillum sp. TSO22-1]PWC52325.1 hypothetical protein TSO221_14770 [Azospirillum sp. TSO22-1]